MSAPEQTPSAWCTRCWQRVGQAHSRDCDTAGVVTLADTKMSRRHGVKAGDRVRVIHFDIQTYDDNLTVPSGTEGTVRDIDDGETIHVQWDNGAQLGLLPEDQWERA